MKIVPATCILIPRKWRMLNTSHEKNEDEIIFTNVEKELSSQTFKILVSSK
jgi:hypothetical protein